MSRALRLQGYLHELSTSLGPHSRRQQHARDYCTALVLPLERKSIEPMAAAVDPDNVRARHQALHHFVSSTSWQD